MPLRVLLVQPDPEAAQPLDRYFKDQGDQVWIATDPVKAVTLLDEATPQILFLDIHYPGAGWLNFLRLARQKFPTLKVIITNQHPDLKREMIARENGAHAFLRQPFTHRWILEAMTAARSDGEPTKPVRNRPLPSPHVQVPVGFKITLPYLVLALLFALAAAYIVSRVVLESVEERFYNQLTDVARQNSDMMVREESQLLETLRLIANTQGVAEAMVAGDAEQLRLLTLPLVANADQEVVDLLDTNAVSLLSIRRNAEGGTANYSFTRGEDFYSRLDFVTKTLQGQSDAIGDKYAGLLVAPWGNYFYVAGPIFDSRDQVVGLVLVGKTVQTLVLEMQHQTLSGVTIYDINGVPLGSTLFTSQETFPVNGNQALLAIHGQDHTSYKRDLIVADLPYSELLGPWEVRSGDDFGILGTSLEQTFLLTSRSSTRIEIFVLIAVSILLVVSIGLIIANRITRPLNRLVDASSQVAQGNLAVKVDARGDDEVAFLSHSFNNMVAGLQEGYVYRDLLGRTVSPEVREQLRQTFSSGNVRLEGQEAVATVLMTDIRSFTTLSEQADPATVLAWLNEYFAALVPIVTSNGGVVNKFDGDAMLAFFGILPKKLSPKQGALAACQAALEMKAAVDKLNEERAGRGEPQMITGIGLNTGVVIAGGLGSTDRMHYTIIGDTVNTTQRLESLTRELYTGSGIVVGHSTYVALAEFVSSFKFEPRGSYAVKGRTEKVQVYNLVGLDKPEQEGQG